MPRGNKSAAKRRATDQAVRQPLSPVEGLDWKMVRTQLSEDLNSVVGYGIESKDDQEFLGELGMTGRQLEDFAERIQARLPRKFGNMTLESLVQTLRDCQTLKNFVATYIKPRRLVPSVN